MMRSPSQLPGIIRSAMSGRSSINRMPTMGSLCPPMGVSCASIAWRAGKYHARSASSWGGRRSTCDRLMADRMALSVGRSVHRSHCATCLHAQAPADLAGRAPLGQISNHTAAKNLTAVQEPLLGAAPGSLRRSPGVLGLVHAARIPVAGDLTAHHRGATPNQVGDTRLRQARIHPRHDRRTILNSKHPTTLHDQPPNSITLHENCLHPMTLPMFDEFFSFE